ncbi:unnamed protein product [Strongylus vulgaris]|uniref:Uncharacterized protein n=1 Tax=Strongylus vulgaris TaxID=40348 RepID=A0A3P7IIL9_STRVU|nr:unnamed protein product [Strongylus vulgaris]
MDRQRSTQHLLGGVGHIGLRSATQMLLTVPHRPILLLLIMTLRQWTLTPTSSLTTTSEEGIQDQKLSGWSRIRALYERPSMEHDCSVRIARMAFLTGFFVGGASTYVQARETYERSNVGRKYLSPSDAFVSLQRNVAKVLPYMLICTLLRRSIRT